MSRDPDPISPLNPVRTPIMRTALIVAALAVALLGWHRYRVVITTYADGDIFCPAWSVAIYNDVEPEETLTAAYAAFKQREEACMRQGSWPVILRRMLWLAGR